MNESTENLFAQLGGVATATVKAPETKETQKPIAGLSGQDEGLDNWRILLVELAYLLNSSFRDAHYWEGVKTQKDTGRHRIVPHVQPGHFRQGRASVPKLRS